MIAIPPNAKCLGTIGPMTGLEFMPTKFQRSLDAVTRYTKQFLCGPNETIATCPAPHSFPNASRDFMCRHVQGDWLVMLDSDMTFSPDTVCKLVEAQKAIEAEHGECGVVTGIYPRRNVPPDTILIHHYRDDLRLWTEFQPEELRSDAPGPCDAAGAGALLIMRWVIERIVLELNVGPFSVWGPLSRESTQEPLGAGTDDLAFCRRLQVLDPPVQLWYTPTVTPGHLSSVGLTVYDWARNKARQKAIEPTPGGAQTVR